MLETIRKLAGHLRWADGRVLQALRRQPEAPEKAFELYRHVLGAEDLWLARIRGEPGRLGVWPALGLEEAEREAVSLHDELDTLVASLDEPALAREVSYANSAGQAFRTPLGEILLHLCLHGVNHRAQVSMLLRQAGLEPVPTDYIAYVRGVPAAIRPEGSGAR